MGFGGGKAGVRIPTVPFGCVRLWVYLTSWRLKLFTYKMRVRSSLQKKRLFHVSPLSGTQLRGANGY